MTNLVVSAIITNTSKKTSDIYKGELQTKAAYLSINKEDYDKAKEFGVKIYKPKDGGDEFAVVKCSKDIRIYNQEGKNTETISGEINPPNFKTTGEVKLNFVKGEKAGREFIRLQAILLPNGVYINEIEQQNPFSDELPF